METLDKPRDGVASFPLYGEQRAEQASFGPSGPTRTAISEFGL